MTPGLKKPSTYIELLQAFPPRPIKSEEDFWATQEIIDDLIDRGELTEDEEDYLDVLGTLVYEYEQTQEPIPAVSGLEVLKFMMEQHNLSQKDLVSVFKTESIASEVLNGNRKLTVAHIQELAKMFNLSPAAFMPLT